MKNAMEEPTLSDVIGFVREFHGISDRVEISGTSRLADDLGIVGDDGEELLVQAARRFDVKLADDREGYRPAFGLEENEYLFPSEGVPEPEWLLKLLRLPLPRIRQTTVADLHEAIVKQKRAQQGGGHVR